MNKLNKYTKKLWKGWISSIQGMATCSNILHLASSGGSHGRDSPQVPSLVAAGGDV
jgi:hypothetical protein